MGRGWTPGPGSKGREVPSSARPLPVWSRPPASSSAHPHLSVKSVTHLPASQGLCRVSGEAADRKCHFPLYDYSCFSLHRSTCSV